MTTEVFNPWIPTRDGKAIDLTAPDPKSIDPETLAVVLSRICRFGGHTIEHYSVAQHSLLVESMVTIDELKLPALLHDAHEAYWGLGDIQSPAKRWISKELGDLLRHQQNLFDAVIAERFFIAPALFHHPQIKLADNVALATERRDVLGPHANSECWQYLPNPISSHITPVPAEQSAENFLERLNELWSDA